MNIWIEKKKHEWLNQQKGLEKEVNIAELEEKERNNEIMPWIKSLISQYAGDIQAKFNEILGNLGEVSIHNLIFHYLSKIIVLYCYILNSRIGAREV